MVEDTLPHLKYSLQELALKLEFQKVQSKSIETQLCNYHMRSATVRKLIDEIIAGLEEA